MHPFFIVGFFLVAFPSQARDKCGPVAQNELDQPADTCTTKPRRTAAPSPYGIWLDWNPNTAYDPSYGLPLHFASLCATAAATLCFLLSLPLPEGWQVAETANCSASMYQPLSQGAAEKKTPEYCRLNIFQPMIRSLTNQTPVGAWYDRASINVAAGAFPGATSTGTVVNNGYPSYIVSV